MNHTGSPIGVSEKPNLDGRERTVLDFKYLGMVVIRKSTKRFVFKTESFR